jgi:hypothetical protein
MDMMIGTAPRLHIDFLVKELLRFLPDGSFALRMRRTIGAELRYRLVAKGREGGSCYSTYHSVDALLVWATKHGGLDPQSIANLNGRFTADDGEEFLPSVRPRISAVEQLAAYGLWMATDGLESYGSIEMGDPVDSRVRPFNGNEFPIGDVVEHQAVCLLLAYRCLCYCLKATNGAAPMIEEAASPPMHDFSALGKAGAAKRHAAMRLLKSYAIALYKAGKWPSANHAAHELKDRIIAYGMTIEVKLSLPNAQRTIAEWFRKSV